MMSLKLAKKLSVFESARWPWKLLGSAVRSCGKPKQPEHRLWLMLQHKERQKVLAYRVVMVR
jgi:hypothetical protein